MQERPTLIIVGSVGAGKGTQADLLVEQLGYLKVEAGEIFRQKAKEDSPLGRKVKEINDTGRYADDQLITELVDDYIKDVPARKGILLDGYPRTIGQAEMLSNLLQESGRDPENIIVIWIKVSREEAKRRLMNRSTCTVCKTVYMSRDVLTCLHCGGDVKPREYDKPEAIERRLEFFEQEVMPLIKYYQQKNKTLEINGEQEIAHVFDEIKEKSGSYLNGEDSV